MQVPVFFTRQVLVKASPGLNRVPSGMVVSPIKTASSRQGGLAGVDVTATAISVAGGVGVGILGSSVAGCAVGEVWGVADATISVCEVVGMLG